MARLRKGSSRIIRGGLFSKHYSYPDHRFGRNIRPMTTALKNKHRQGLKLIWEFYRFLTENDA